MKDKICILKIHDTFVLWRIYQKCQGTQIKAFLCFGITQRDVALCIPPLIRSIKTLLFEYPGIFGICVIKQKCLVFSNYRFYLQLKGGWKKEGDCDPQTAFIWVPWHFWHILDKTKVFYLVKTHILSFMIPPLFAHFLRETFSISFKMRKKGRGHKQ